MRNRGDFEHGILKAKFIENNFEAPEVFKPFDFVFT